MQDIVIREAVAEDAETLIALKKSYIRGTTTIPLFEDEYTNTVIEERELIARLHSSPNSLLLVAEHNGMLIGNLDLIGSPRRKLLHTTYLGMGIAHLWQGKGIGSLLMQNALKWAAEKSPVEIIMLELYSINIAGKKLYEKHGFKECGVIENFFREGVVCEKISMVKYV